MVAACPASQLRSEGAAALAGAAGEGLLALELTLESEEDVRALPEALAGRGVRPAVVGLAPIAATTATPPIPGPISPQPEGVRAIGLVVQGGPEPADVQAMEERCARPRRPCGRTAGGSPSG
jgi:hypothetical protein